MWIVKGHYIRYGISTQRMKFTSTLAKLIMAFDETKETCKKKEPSILKNSKYTIMRIFQLPIEETQNQNSLKTKTLQS